MMFRSIVLIQAHGNVNYIVKLALSNPTTKFLVHFDKKFILNINDKHTINSFISEKNNLEILPDSLRVSVFWGGYSQLQATLNLMQYALKFKSVEYFHLISAECLPLYYLESIEKDWDKLGGGNFIECFYRPEVSWRLKVKVFYSESNFTRTLLGRVMNRLHKTVGNILNPSKWDPELLCYGSSWFSVNRDFVVEAINAYNNKYFEKFKGKPCADEHAFQVFIKEKMILDVEYSNKRYVDFEKGESSPKYIGYESIKKLTNNKEVWFVRKVNINTSLNYIDRLKK